MRPKHRTYLVERRDERALEVQHVDDDRDHTAPVVQRRLQSTHRTGLAQIVGRAQASDRDSHSKRGASRAMRADWKMWAHLKLQPRLLRTEHAHLRRGVPPASARCVSQGWPKLRGLVQYFD